MALTVSGSSDYQMHRLDESLAVLRGVSRNGREQRLGGLSAACCLTDLICCTIIPCLSTCIFHFLESWSKRDVFL